MESSDSPLQIPSPLFLWVWWRLQCKEKPMTAGMVTLALREQGSGQDEEQCSEHLMSHEMLSSPRAVSQQPTGHGHNWDQSGTPQLPSTLLCPAQGNLQLAAPLPLQNPQCPQQQHPMNHCTPPVAPNSSQSFGLKFIFPVSELQDTGRSWWSQLSSGFWPPAGLDGVQRSAAKGRGD